MRARRSLRMILHAVNWFGLVAKPFHRLVIQVDPGHCDVGGQRLCIHRESVILRGDFNLPGFQIFHRLISAAMAKF